jgi:hypothetical protein
MKFRTWIGSDTTVLVEFDYQPREPMTREHPGCDERATITAVATETFPDDDILDCLSGDCVEMLASRALDWVAEDDGEGDDE